MWLGKVRTPSHQLGPKINVQNILGLVDFEATKLFTPANRSHKYKQLQNHCSVEVQKYYFDVRIVPHRNNLRAQELDFSRCTDCKITLVTLTCLII